MRKQKRSKLTVLNFPTYRFKKSNTYSRDDLESGPKRQKLILKTRKTEIEVQIFMYFY